jgi:lia operon protein LiaF
LRRLRNQVAGFALVFIGISIVVDLIGFGYDLLGPLFLFGIGLIMHQHVHRWIGTLFFALAAIALFDGVLDIDVAEFLLAAFFFYAGYRLLTGKPVPFIDRVRPAGRSGDSLGSEDPPFAEGRSRYERGPSRSRGSLIGNVRLEEPFELEDMQLSHAVCDVTIDLSKAVIPEGESTIVISSLIGDVDIYVPYDMSVSVGASAAMGDLKILGNKHGGLGCRVHTETAGYKQSPRRVKISVSLLIGDVDVRVL